MVEKLATMIFHEKTTLLFVNFGGPRSLEEVFPFLQELLTDKDVIKTPFPKWLQDLLFTRIAKKRSFKVTEDYRLIGGKSPIFEDTEWVAKKIEERLSLPVIIFHRYLKQTHQDFLKKINEIDTEQILVFPFYPQFSYATTGSIARWMDKHLSKDKLKKMRWIKSYASHAKFAESFTRLIQDCLQKHQLAEEETILLFSAHGLPQKFIQQGDVYEKECMDSFRKIGAAFPKALKKISYQSQFGKEEWIKPYTNEVCNEVAQWGKGYKNVVFIPLSFTSDHIETLFEIEEEYLPLVKEKGFASYRCPALNRESFWIESILEILTTSDLVPNDMLFRR